MSVSQAVANGSIVKFGSECSNVVQGKEYMPRESATCICFARAGNLYLCESRNKCFATVETDGYCGTKDMDT